MSRVDYPLSSMHARSREPGALQPLASDAVWALYTSCTVRQLITHGIGHPGVAVDKSPLTEKETYSENREATPGSEYKTRYLKKSGAARNTTGTFSP